MAGANTGRKAPETGELSPLSRAGYRAIEHLRGTLLGHSLQRESTLEGIVQTCLDGLPSLLTYEMYSVYLLDRLGETRRIGVPLKAGDALTDSQCRDLGDAVFALLAPHDSVILTTNLKDHEPLASALGKTAQLPGLRDEAHL